MASDGPDCAGRPDRPVTTEYRLHLFVAGNELNSRQARDNLKRICSEYMTADCEVVITDVLEDFKPALEAGIYVTPALLIGMRGPNVTVFGNLSDTGKVLQAMGLQVTVDE